MTPQEHIQNQYKVWLKTNKVIKLSSEEEKQLDKSMTKIIVDEINDIQSTKDDPHHQRLKMLKQKHFEVRKKLKRFPVEDLERIKNSMWTPTDRSDYRRIIPEMILVSDRIRIKKKDIFGNESFDTYEHNAQLKKDWEVLSILISSARQDSVPGRSLHYIVRDKITQKYLGFISITGTLPNLSCRNSSIFNTNNIKKYFQKGGVIARNMANGQKIVACQPFGSLYNGGKLLTLLCSSKQVADDWKLKYGDVLVSVDTTSLYGAKGSSGTTQYDGLRPFWWLMGQTSGETPIKPSDEVYNLMKEWLRKRYSEDWFKIVMAKTKDGQNAVREQKNTLMRKVFSKLTINKLVNTNSGDIRGVYLSKLYKNTDEFCRGEIQESELVPAFNNSIEFLSEFWKFGFDGDTKSYVNPDIKNLMIKLQEELNVAHKAGKISSAQKRVSLEKSSSAKRRLRSNINKFISRFVTDEKVLEDLNQNPQKYEYYGRKLKVEQGISHRLPTDYNWFGPMVGLSWAETKERYADYLAGKTSLTEQ
jgi:hypothetical protein